MPVLCARTSSLLLIDVQAQLVPALEEADAFIARIDILARAAKLLAVPVVASEHCPDKLGSTLVALQPWVDTVLGKTSFDLARAQGALTRLDKARTLVVAGCEAHVCVLQSVFGLQQAGFNVAVVADAIASRTGHNRDLAIERLRAAGVPIVSTEMVLFEWLEGADNPHFRDILALIKKLPPGVPKTGTVMPKPVGA